LSTSLDAKAKVIFGEAFELSGNERATYLNSACAGDAALRARIDALLSAAERDDRFLVQQSSQVDHAAPDLPPGTRIGNYIITAHLGEGGFGSVFLAEQQHPVRRRVALKIIKLGMDTRAVIARFE
jgi:eukaryotic-like serine/threonine-protein kinase